MRILVVGECPYRLTSSGRMASDILVNLRKEKHIVGCAAWAFDSDWFVHDKNRRFIFEKEEKSICQLFPFVNTYDKAATELYEIMKSFKPNIVVSIGDAKKTAFIYSIKALYPDLFKWICILKTGVLPISYDFYEAFSYMDHVIVNNQDTYDEVKRITRVKCDLVYYGVDKKNQDDICRKEHEGLNVTYITHNDWESNIPVFLEAICKAGDGISGYLHTDVCSNGFYNIEKLMDMYNIKGNLSIPKRFVSSNDGFSYEEMVEIHLNSDVIVDCAMNSSTSISILEGISYGCFPIMNRIGTKKDILNEMEKAGDVELSFLRGISYIGREGELYNIVDSDELAEILKSLLLKKENDKDFMNIREKRIILDKFKDKIYFLKRIKDIIFESISNKSTLVLDVM